MSLLIGKVKLRLKVLILFLFSNVKTISQMY